MFWNKCNCKPAEAPPCQHVWRKITQHILNSQYIEKSFNSYYTATNGNVIPTKAKNNKQMLVLVLTCTKCGELDKFTATQ